MKLLLLTIAFITSLFATAIDEEVESTHLCKTRDSIYLVTVTTHPDYGRTLWLDDWEHLGTSAHSSMLPVIYEKSLRSTREITSWFKSTFGPSVCNLVNEPTITKQMRLQGLEP